MTATVQTTAQPTAQQVRNSYGHAHGGSAVSIASQESFPNNGFARALGNQTEPSETPTADLIRNCNGLGRELQNQPTKLDTAATRLLERILGTKPEACELFDEEPLAVAESLVVDVTPIADGIDETMLSLAIASTMPLAPTQVSVSTPAIAELEFPSPIIEGTPGPLTQPLFATEALATNQTEEPITVEPVLVQKPLASVEPTGFVAVDLDVPEVVAETETDEEVDVDTLKPAHENSRLEHREGPLHAAVTPAQPAQPTHGGPATRTIPASPSLARNSDTVTEVDAAASTDNSPLNSGSVIALAEQTSRPATTTAVNPAAEPTQPALQPAPAEQIVTVLEPLRHEATCTYELVIELQPEELGRVEVRVEMRNGVMHAHLRAEQPAAAQAIRDAVTELRDHLTAFGVQTGAINVDAGGTGRRHERPDTTREEFNRRDEQSDSHSANQRSPRLPKAAPDRIDARA